MLTATIERVKRENWKPTQSIKQTTKDLPEYPGDDVYTAELYLLQNINNASTVGLFNMQDVGFASALAASDVALQEINHILKDKNRPHAEEGQADDIQRWIEESRKGVEAMWNGERSFYDGKYTPVLTNDEDLHSPLSATTFLNVPTSSSFWIFYSTYSRISNYFLPSSHADSMVFNLLESENPSGFNCGKYGVRSSGCAVSGDGSVGVYPEMNWILSRGLKVSEAKQVNKQRTAGAAMPKIFHCEQPL